jgi:hypothetical protein
MLARGDDVQISKEALLVGDQRRGHRAVLESMVRLLHVIEP